MSSECHKSNTHTFPFLNLNNIVDSLFSWLRKDMALEKQPHLPETASSKLSEPPS